MKSLMLFLQLIFQELGDLCRTSTDRDIKTCLYRVEHEGLSFLTITLSNFAKDFERCLELGSITDASFHSFKSGKGGLPRFLGGFLRLVFSEKDGRLLNDPSIDAIFAIRQICRLFEKINLPCSDERVKIAMAGYIECDADISALPDFNSHDLFESFTRIGSMLWNDTFNAVERNLNDMTLIPRHGPGSTAEKLSSNAKWYQQEWTERLEAIFPHMWYLTHGSYSLALDVLGQVDIREPGRERPVRVVHVPKTQKTPRIIAIEPACMMYAQQALLREFEKHLLGDDYPGCFISWRSQIPNQNLAFKGSKDRSLATLDLSEASDRVSYQHVMALLRNYPNLAEGVDACRSMTADVLGHGVITLSKFASMGSALCFPFESMVFCTAIFVGIEKVLNRPLSLGDIHRLKGAVRVYGDDLIVPVDYVHSVMSTLESFGFVVNVHKSFWNGKFRESCGEEFFDGNRVTISRCRSFFPSSRRHVPEIISTVAFRNHLYKAGLWRSAYFLDDIIERVIPFPYVSEESQLVGRFSFLGVEPTDKLDPHLQHPIVKGVVLVAKPPKDPLDGYGALLKCLLSLENRDIDEMPIVDPRHLERAGRPRSVGIKTRWLSPV